MTISVITTRLFQPYLGFFDAFCKTTVVTASTIHSRSVVLHQVLSAGKERILFATLLCGISHRTISAFDAIDNSHNQILAPVESRGGKISNVTNSFIKATLNTVVNTADSIFDSIPHCCKCTTHRCFYSIHHCDTVVLILFQMVVIVFLIPFTTVVMMVFVYSRL